MMINPLKNGWRVNEDAGFVPDQIKDRVNSESNYEWAKDKENPPMLIRERIAYNEKVGRDYLKFKSSFTK